MIHEHKILRISYTRHITNAEVEAVSGCPAGFQYDNGTTLGIVRLHIAHSAVADEQHLCAVADAADDQHLCAVADAADEQHLCAVADAADEQHLCAVADAADEQHLCAVADAADEQHLCAVADAADEQHLCAVADAIRKPPADWKRSPRRSINQSINVKFVGRRYTRRPGAPTVVSGTHDQKVHS